jgi:hypothetical protein
MSIIAPEQPASSNGPQVGMKVQIIGERGIFLVTLVDQRRHTVDLIPLNGGQTVRGIHISALAITTDHDAQRSLFARLARRKMDAA